MCGLYTKWQQLRLLVVVEDLFAVVLIVFEVLLFVLLHLCRVENDDLSLDVKVPAGHAIDKLGEDQFFAIAVHYHITQNATVSEIKINITQH